MLKRAIITVFTLFAMCSVALADDWVASKLRGGVFIFTAGEWVQLKRGDVVSDDSAVQTAKNARVIFTRGKESISLRGDTRIRISDKDGSKYTVVSQDFGEITVDVEKRNVQHFEVRAPLLAAVVKGTKFTVTAARGRGAASIAVDRGRVEARDDRAGMKVDVMPRQKVELNVKDKPVLTVEGSGAKEPIRSTATNKVLSVKEIINKAKRANPKAKIEVAQVENIAEQQGMPASSDDLVEAEQGAQEALDAAKAAKQEANQALEAAIESGDPAAIAEAEKAAEAAKDAEKAAKDDQKVADDAVKDAEKAAKDAADAAKAANDAAKAAAEAAAAKAAEDAAKEAEKAAKDAEKAAKDALKLK